jgi:cation diffusion facilitator family transporter
MYDAQAENNLKKRAALISVVSNISLIVLKLAAGLFTGSLSIISEAAHSAVDLLAACVAYLAVKKAGKPPDGEHAYGHGKIENLSAAFEALLIVGAAVFIFYEAVGKLFAANTPEFLEYGILVMFFSMAVNFFVSSYLYKIAKQTGSRALEADALHLRADIYTCGGVLAALAAMKVTGIYWLDPGAAILVAFLILKAAYDLTKKNLNELTDASLSKAEEKIIYDLAKNHPLVISLHKLRTRSSGCNKIIDMHLILKKDMPLDQAHAVSDEIEEVIKKSVPNCDITIHLEPCSNLVESCPPDCPFQEK